MIQNTHHRLGSIQGGDNRLRLIRRWPSEGAKAWTKSLIALLEHDARFFSLIAYGSAVREVESSSDVDLLVIVSGPAFDIPTPPMEIDLKLMFEETIGQKVIDKNDILIWCLQYGEVLMERAFSWTRFKKTWCDKVPFPSSKAAAERSRKALVLYRDLLAHGDPDAAQEQWMTHLTQLSRFKLINASVFPASRPELPHQLDTISEHKIANELRAMLRERLQQ